MPVVVEMKIINSCSSNASVVVTCLLSLLSGSCTVYNFDPYDVVVVVVVTRVYSSSNMSVVVGPCSVRA